jgi:hypothetical protein
MAVYARAQMIFKWAPFFRASKGRSLFQPYLINRKYDEMPMRVRHVAVLLTVCNLRREIDVADS